MMAKLGRPMTARPSAPDRVLPQAARPNRARLAPPTTGLAEAQERPVPQREQRPEAADSMKELGQLVRPTTGPVLERAGRPGAARQATLPRSVPVRLRWKAERRARPKMAMWQVTKQLERRAHPRCQRSG